VCEVCVRSPGEILCEGCDNSAFCQSCYKVFHAMGRKRKHKHKLMLEDTIYNGYGTEEDEEDSTVNEEKTYCHVCMRRVAIIPCPNPDCRSLQPFIGCDSCFENKHQPDCDKNQFELLHLFTGGEIDRGGATTDTNNKSDNNSNNDKKVLKHGPSDRKIEYEGSRNYHGPPICVVCEEKADQKCVECQDLYCSRTWMGNPGCFLQVRVRVRVRVGLKVRLRVGLRVKLRVGLRVWG
jgi:hypothetical protein